MPACPSRLKSRVSSRLRISTKSACRCWTRWPSTPWLPRVKPWRRPGWTSATRRWPSEPPSWWAPVRAASPRMTSRPAVCMARASRGCIHSASCGRCSAPPRRRSAWSLACVGPRSRSPVPAPRPTMRWPRPACCCARARRMLRLRAAARPVSPWGLSRRGRPCGYWPTTPAGHFRSSGAGWCWVKARASSCWRRWNMPSGAAPRSWPSSRAPACRPTPPTSCSRMPKAQRVPCGRLCGKPVCRRRMWITSMRMAPAHRSTT